MLRVEAISKWYLPPPPLLRPLVRVASRSPVQALKDVTMHVDQGEVLGLVGPNGAGKTTLIRVIATLLEPDDGTAHVHGFEVTRQPWEVRRHLGLVLEGNRGLYGRLTGRQNLEFFGVFAGLTPAVARQRADDQIRQTKLDHQDKLMFGYSSGMHARLSLARALLTNPSLLVLDESTRSLDPVAITMATFFFISRLVGTPAELAPYRGGYFDFAVVGLVVTSFSLLGLSTFNRKIVDEQRNGTFEILLASPTRLGQLLLGSLLVPLALTTLDLVIYMGVGIGLLGSGLQVTRILLALPLLGLTLAIYSAFGILSAAFILLTKRGDPFSSLFIQLSNLLAGALFPIILLPGPLQVLARFIPTYWGLQGIRGALLTSVPPAALIEELAALLVFNALLLPLSLWAFGRAVRFCRVAGTLADY
jgi:ABC-2 type transport system permease protein